MTTVSASEELKQRGYMLVSSIERQAAVQDRKGTTVAYVDVVCGRILDDEGRRVCQVLVPVHPDRNGDTLGAGAVEALAQAALKHLDGPLTSRPPRR